MEDIFSVNMMVSGHYCLYQGRESSKLSESNKNARTIIERCMVWMLWLRARSVVVEQNLSKICCGKEAKSLEEFRGRFSL